MGGEPEDWRLLELFVSVRGCCCGCTASVKLAAEPAMTEASQLTTCVE
jgi:hypothetical protein